MTFSPHLARRLRLPTYLILGMVLVFQLSDLLLAVTPIQAENPQWRFGAVGLAANTAAQLLLLLLLFFAAALLLEDRPVIWFVGGVAALGAVLLFVGMAGFALDAVQIRGRVQPEIAPKFVVASTQAIGKLLLEAGAAVALALNAWRVLRASRRVKEHSIRHNDVVVLAASR